ncbi:nuclear pore protein 84/107 [Geopyxis carbonaria]|nr:nuclear pore protein 84/107 [Geopyxis carbonaria]
MMHQRSSSVRSAFFRNGPASPIAQRHQRAPSTDESWDMGDDTGSDGAHEGDDSRMLALQNDDNLQSDITMEFYKPELHRFALHLDEVTRKTDVEKSKMGRLLLERFLDFAVSKQEELEKNSELEPTEDDEDPDALELEKNYWRMESQTWELLLLLVDQSSTTEDLEDISDRFRSNVHIREQMTRTEPIFRQLNLILEWLHRNAPEPLDEDEMLQGGGGWVYTKEKIKGDKRVRFSQKLSLFPSGMGNGFSIKPKGRNIVTELDPDAPSRQKKDLEEEDESRERTLMRLVWMYLRRGEVERAQVLCEEAGEWWRAASLSGQQDAWDPNVDGFTDEDEMSDGNGNFAPVQGNRRREFWKRMCYALASRKDGETFERAVYGILSGDLDNVIPVCETWEDHLFAHVNSLVEGAYSSNLTKLGRVPPAVLSFSTFDTVAYHSRAPTIWEDGTIMPRIIDSISAIPHLEESKLPLRVIQGSFISNRFKGLVEELNEQLSIYQKTPDFSPMEDEGRTLDVCDCRLLRFVVHVILIMQAMEKGFTENEPQHAAAENIIGAYIQLLVEAGEFELLPLYASRLSPGKAIETMGNALVNLNGESRREEVLRLMQMHKIDVEGCLRKTMDITLEMTESVYEDAKLKSGQGVLVNPFNGENEEEDNLLVSSLEWLLLGGPTLHGELVRLGVECYKRFLFTGRLSGAKMLFENVRSENVIPRQLKPGYVDEDDMFDDEIQDLDDDTMLAAAVYIQMESMIRAVIALDEWRKALPQKIERIDRAHKDELRNLFQEATDRLLEVIQNLLDMPDMLALPGVVDIRNMYVPEMVLALHQTYVEASKLLSKQWLVHSLDLAVIVADPEKSILKTFQEAGRLEEYVNDIARASRDMLGVAQEGGRGTAATAVAIWNVA